MCSSDDFFILKIKIIVTGVKNINIFKAFKAHIAKLSIRKITLLTIAQAVFEQSHSLFLSSSNYLITTRAKKKKNTNTKKQKPRQHIKKQSHYFTNKGLSSQSYGFSI